MVKFSQQAKNLAQNLLAKADVHINGARPWDVHVHNENFYSRVLREGSLGLAESYMDGWWSSKNLDQFLEHLLRAKLDRQVLGNWRTVLQVVGQIIMNPQTMKKSRIVGEKHYDIGNELFSLMLDKRMVYSCGYWSSPNQKVATLDEAQEAKLALICEKLHLKKGQKILDIGCGWGGFAKYAAEKYGVRVVGVTISQEQAQLAKEICKDLPVEIQLKDYREIEGTFDAVVSIGMFEHVGYKNYHTFMEIVAKHLSDEGLFLLHTIGQNDTTKTTDPWVTKYIFPNSMLPSIKQIAEAIEKQFVMEDWHNFGPDYDKTLMQWHENFKNNWHKISHAYSPRFFRMWEYYLLGSAATFRCRNNELWQIVLSKNGVQGGYESVR